MAEGTKRIVTGRISKRQKVKLLEILRSNRNVGRGQYTINCGPTQHKKVWEEVAWELNGIGEANKTSEQWKKCWIDWKTSVRRQYLKIRAYNNRTGNLAPEDRPKPLQDLDKEIIDYFSRNLVDGDGSTPEGGFNDIEILENITVPSTSTPSAARRPIQQTASSSNSFRSCFEETKRFVEAQNTLQNEKLDAILSSINKQNYILEQLLKEVRHNKE